MWSKCGQETSWCLCGQLAIQLRSQMWKISLGSGTASCVISALLKESSSVEISQAFKKHSGEPCKVSSIGPLQFLMRAEGAWYFACNEEEMEVQEYDGSLELVIPLLTFLEEMPGFKILCCKFYSFICARNLHLPHCRINDTWELFSMYQSL